MPKPRTNLTLSGLHRRLAGELIRHYGFESYTELIEHLINRKHARVFKKAGTMPALSSTAALKTVQLSNSPVPKPDNQKPKGNKC